MKLKAHWPGALEAARQGDLAAANAARLLDPEGALADYFYGRCLAEAGVELAEAEACLRRAFAVQPSNPLIIQSLALALAGSGDAAKEAEAAAIWSKRGLPQDMDLLGRIALVLELQTQPWPADSALSALPWPENLVRPNDELPVIAANEASDAAAASESDANEVQPASLPDTLTPRPLNYFARRRLIRAVAQLERRLDGVSEARRKTVVPRFWDDQPVDDRLDRVHLVPVKFDFIVHVVHVPIDAHPHEACFAHVFKSGSVMSLSVFDERGEHLESGTRGQLQHRIHDLLGALPGHFPPARWTVGDANPRI